MPDVQELQGARVLITWDGHHIAVRGNVPMEIVVALTAAAQKIALDKWLTGTRNARDIVRNLRGES